MASVPFSKTDSAVTVILDGAPYSVPRGDLRYPRILEALRDKADEADILVIVEDVPEASSGGRPDAEFFEEIAVIPGVTYNGHELRLHEVPAPAYISSKARSLFNEGFSLVPLANFLKRLPDSFRIRNSLLEFLDHGNLPLMEDGRFVAYKRVRSTFMDIHSNSFSNAPGAVLSMPRYEVDDNPNNTCSYGFHVCSHDYLRHFGSARGSEDKVVAVAVAPEDVVSIPVDYNNTKMRVCGYVVLNELPMEWHESDILSDTSMYLDDEDEDRDSIFCLYSRDENEDHSEADDEGWVLLDQFGTLEAALSEADSQYVGDDGYSYQVRNVLEDKVLAQLNGIPQDKIDLMRGLDGVFRVSAKLNGITLRWVDCNSRSDADETAVGMARRHPGATVEILEPTGEIITTHRP